MRLETQLAPAVAAKILCVDDACERTSEGTLHRAPDADGGRSKLDVRFPPASPFEENTNYTYDNYPSSGQEPDVPKRSDLQGIRSWDLEF